MIYLDYSATTPVNEEVLDTYYKVTKKYIGNPNSLHKLGLEANELISSATKQIEKILNIKDYDVIYTSGASESNNTAIKGICSRYKNRGNHIITTQLEHSSITAPISYLANNGFVVDFVKLKDNGQVDLDDLKKLLNDKTILVSISSVNSEIGIIQPIEEISKILKEYPKCFFHSDMTQSIGKQKININNVDLVSFSSQKFFGPKGIGCLLKRKKIVIDPLIHGGKSTTIYRSGTPSPALICSMSKAVRLAYDNFDTKYNYVLELSNYLKNKLKDLDIYINSNDYCLPHIINFSLKNIKSETMLHALEAKEIYISTQTACSVSNVSKAVYSVTKNEEKSTHSMRISISYETTKQQIDIFVETLKNEIEKLGELNESNKNKRHVV